MRGLSVALIVNNEEQNIRDCLESVSWADEIVVVDSHSTDRTIEICRSYTSRIFIRKWTGYAEQKQFAIDKCRNEYVLNIDADERVREELRDEILELLSSAELADGYFIARRSRFLGKWIRYAGWYPGYQLRLFKRSRARVSCSRVHEGVIVDGRTEKLRNDLDHFSHPSLFVSLEKLDRYSSLEALDRLNRKKVRWYHFIFHPLSAFLVKYVRQKGFLDGIHGYLLCWISAFLKMVLYMKIWHLQRASVEKIYTIHEAQN